LDAKKVQGVFNFRLSNGFAVDEELYSYVTVHSNDATAAIFIRLWLMTVDKYLEDNHFYFKAIQMNQLKTPTKKKQSLINRYLTKNYEMSDARKK